ncbi:MAG: hypothetical protein KDD55_07730 [Bdellovibrionales bacterium]|nr:hypothetical protein [Bdellovibrionales bacterium]
MKRLILHFGLIAFGLCLALVLCEVVLRAIYPTCTVLRTFRYDRGVFLSPLQEAACSNGEFDVVVRSNSLGFHDHEHGREKPSETCRVLFLGDSLIEAVQVDRTDSVTALVEDSLRNESKNVEVLNFASSGAGPSQYLRVLETLGLSYHPDLVVLWLYLGNDIRNSHRELQPSNTMPFHTLDSEGNLVFVPAPAKVPASPLRKFFGGITFFRLFREALRETPLQKPLPWLGLAANEGKASRNRKGIPVDWNTYRKNHDGVWEEAYEVAFRVLAKTKEILDAHHIPFVVAVIPTNLDIEDRWKEALSYYHVTYIPEEWDFKGPRRRVLTRLKELGIDSVDLLPFFQEDFQKNGISHSWKKDAHWNERGHSLAAKVIEPRVLEELQSCLANDS